MVPTLFVLDGHSIAHRMFYAMPSLSTRGVPMGAVYGFARILLKLIREEEPQYIAVAFDTPGPTFRHKTFKEYKAHRDKTPDDLSPQFPLIKELLEIMDITVLEQTEYEADDILGTLARQFSEQKVHTVLVTGDRDSLQLVEDRVTVRYTKKGITEIVDYTPERVRGEYGVEPRQLIEVKALMGDSSDNIPGVPGIGEKTALKLIGEYGSLEEVLAHRSALKGKRLRQSLEEYGEQARLSRDLVLIRQNIDLSLPEGALSYKEPDWQALAGLFRQWQFTSLLSSLPGGEKQQLFSSEKIQAIQVPHTRSWKDFCADFTPAKPMPLFLDVEGERPKEYVLKALILQGEEGIYALDLKALNSEDVLCFLKPYLEDEELPKIGHDLKIGVEVLEEKGILLQGIVMDTALAAYLLNAASGSGEFSHILEQNTGDIAEGPEATVHHLPSLARTLKDELQKQDMLKLFAEVELPLIPFLARMENNGILLDIPYLKELSQALEERLQDIRETIYELSGVTFNINSPKQLGEVLFETLQLPVLKKTKTGYGTGAEILEKLASEHPVVEYVLQHRQLAKLQSTYIDALPPLVHGDTGRLHTSFQQLVTATGRLSSIHPNLQNIPIRTPEGQKIRRAFQAQEGYVLLGADYSQIELRVLAHLAQEKGLQEAFENNEDVHSRTAREVFHLQNGEVTAEHRRRAKAINFGLAYGMSAYGLSQDLNISQGEAKKYIQRYFARYPGIKDYVEKCIEKAQDQGYISTLMNRKRYLPDIQHRVAHRRRFAERMAINTPVQGSAADIMKMAMIQVGTVLENWPRARMLLQVHDELILEVPVDQVKELGVAVKEAMEGACPLDVPLLVDVKAGDNWLDMEPVF